MDKDSTESAYRYSESFIREAAGKHFVALTYVLAKDGQKLRDFASCFVVDVSGHWVLVTAGHVINQIAQLRAAGWAIQEARLVDAFAGGSFEKAVPFDFDPADWMAIEDNDLGVDVAVHFVSGLFKLALEKGGVEGFPGTDVGPAEYELYHQVVLAGVPAEKSEYSKGKGVMGLMAVPITACDPSDAMPERVGSRLGKLPPNPSEPLHRLESVQGMSGCPVFGINPNSEGGPSQYKLVGVQSSWLKGERIVRFCQIDYLIDHIQVLLAELPEEGTFEPAQPR